MNYEPMVSVVIVNWNGGETLINTVRSLFSETRSITFEVVLVDNNSQDSSATRAKDLFPQIQLINLSNNLGFASGNNVGFRLCKAKYILLLNSDTVTLPSTVLGMVNFLETHSFAGCVGCRHLNLDRTLQRSVDNFPSLLSDFLAYSDLHRLPIVGRFMQRRYAWWGTHAEARQVDWVNGSCMMVRRAVIDEVGGLDEEFFLYAEEIDWCYRIRERGFEIWFTPDAEVIHLGGMSSIYIANQRIAMIYSGQYRFYQKHYSAWKCICLRFVFVFIAFPRVALLFLLRLTGRQLTTKPIFQLLVQEKHISDPHIMLRAWFRILLIAWKPDKYMFGVRDNGNR